jgi:hypothetical protein
MIIAGDFDGTLHDGQWPSIGEPVDSCIWGMRALKERGHYLIIWTCREGIRQTEMINWLLEHGIPFDRVNDHVPGQAEKYGYAARKVYAHLYIDDKQVGGLPGWIDIVNYVEEVEYKWKQSHEQHEDL